MENDSNGAFMGACLVIAGMGICINGWTFRYSLPIPRWTGIVFVVFGALVIIEDIYRARKAKRKNRFSDKEN